jgi:plastocyanin
MKNRILSVVTLTLLLSITFVSCSKSSSNNNNLPAAPNTVTIADMAFTPPTITVTVGTAVTWKNNDNMTHTVTADDDSYDSGNIGSGSSFTKTFSTAGTYPYHCSIHPTMTGKVVVN